MTVKDIADLIEQTAPLCYQESYDNSGLLVGSYTAEVSCILLCIDVTDDVIDEAIEKDCNLIISHHPLIFTGIKKLTGDNYIERCIIKAVKSDINIYAAHTNIDNVINGVNGKIAEKIGLKNVRVLKPMPNLLLKLVTFVPNQYAEKVRTALFTAGAGSIGNYSRCSYNMDGTGTFMADDKAAPFVGKKNELHYEEEIRIEVLMPKHAKNKILHALLRAHPYEEPAYDIIAIENERKEIGSGIIGELEKIEPALDFLKKLKDIFNLQIIKHTNTAEKNIQRVAICGGAGSGFLRDAIRQKADIFISGDFKYHEFFESDDKIIIADIGHYESEQFTKDIFYEIITKKIPTFAIQISNVKTNPINYL